MIDVNIWESTTVLFGKKITHGIFGPLCASESAGENVGHANLTLDINESSKNYEYIEAHFGKLNPKKTLSIIPAKVPSQINWSHLVPKTVYSYQFTNSKWPEGKVSVTGIFKTDTKRAFHLSIGRPGVEAQFNTHDNDMVREDIESNTRVVAHKKSSKEAIQTEKQTNLAFLSELSTLEVNLENVSKCESKLNELKLEISTIMERTEQCTASSKTEIHDYQMAIKSNTISMEKINRRLIALERTSSYLNKIENMDRAARNQFLTILEQITSFKIEHEGLLQNNIHLQERINEVELKTSGHKSALNQELSNTKLAINYYSEALETALKEINGKTVTDLEQMKAESRKRVDYTSRKEQFLIAKEKTEGRHPDHIIRLPVTQDGLDFHLDEIKVLQAMEQERDSNYSFIFNNCATSVKRCLLAGISKPLREQLKTTGLNESFFQLRKIETCSGLKSWAKKLESHIVRLNFPTLAEQAHSITLPVCKL